MKILKVILILLLAAFVGLQFVHNKMPGYSEAGRDDLFFSDSVPQNVASILKTSCYDCHSNQTIFPWYAKVAPASWLLADDIAEGRKELNFSEWGTFNKRHKIGSLRKIREEVNEGHMPLKAYLIIHRNARLNSAQKEALDQWTRNKTKEILH